MVVAGSARARSTDSLTTPWGAAPPRRRRRLARIAKLEGEVALERRPIQSDAQVPTGVDSGGVTNLAHVYAPNPYNGDFPLNADATATVPAVRNPAVSVDKVASITSGAAVGDVITYTYTVENTGNVTLTDVTLTDAHTSAAGTAALSISSGGVIATLAPGDSVDLTATYTVTQADIDAGVALTNVVSLTSTSPSGTMSPTAIGRVHRSVL